MKDQWLKGIVPPQNTGQSSYTYSRRRCRNNTIADSCYSIASRRLLDVNKWHGFAGKATAEFNLVDEQGKQLNRSARKGDLFRIRLPAPGNPAGSGDDWVQVQEVGESSIGKRTITYMTVRPVENPVDKSDETAHFFTTNATSTFMVYLDGLTVTAAVYGRNEHPNTNSHNLFNRIRNWLIYLGAQLGLANVQWKSLTNGLLKNAGH